MSARKTTLIQMIVLVFVWTSKTLGSLSLKASDFVCVSS